MIIVYAWGLLTLFMETARCAKYEAIKDLHQQLFQGYNKQLRPVNNSSDTVHLQMYLVLTKVGDLNMKNEFMVSWIEYSVIWQDQRMVWNQLEYPGIPSIRVARGDLWTPDLEVRALDNKELGGQQMIQVSSEGIAQCWGSIKVKTSCPMILKKFPFDSHTCSIVISTSYTEEDVNITEVVYKEGNVLINGEWNLTSVTVKRESLLEDGKPPRSVVRIQVEISRQSLYLVLTFLGPMITIVAVNPLVFLVKHHSGERITVAITLFLSLTMFLSSLNDLLPRTSTSTSLLSVVAYMQFQMSGGIVISTIISHCLFHSTNHGCFVKFWAAVLRVKRDKAIEPVDSDAKDNDSTNDNQVVDKFKLVHKFDRHCLCWYVFMSLAYATLTFTVPFV